MQFGNRKMVENFQKLRKDTIFLNKILHISKRINKFSIEHVVKKL